MMEVARKGVGAGGQPHTAKAGWTDEHREENKRERTKPRVEVSDRVSLLLTCLQFSSEERE